MQKRDIGVRKKLWFRQLHSVNVLVMTILKDSQLLDCYRMGSFLNDGDIPVYTSIILHHVINVYKSGQQWFWTVHVMTFHLTIACNALIGGQRFSLETSILSVLPLVILLQHKPHHVWSFHWECFKIPWRNYMKGPFKIMTKKDQLLFWSITWIYCALKTAPNWKIIRQ